MKKGYELRVIFEDVNISDHSYKQFCTVNEALTALSILRCSNELFYAGYDYKFTIKDTSFSDDDVYIYELVE